jgi:hypothetical protein
MRTTILPEERERRNQLSTRYKNGQKKDRIDDEIRGIRMAINILIQRERELLEESRKLSPKKKEAA